MSDLGSAAPSTRRRTKAKPYSNGKPDPSQELLQALQAMRSGDFSVRMTGDHLGIEGKIADTFNEIVAANQRMAQQLERVGQSRSSISVLTEPSMSAHEPLASPNLTRWRVFPSRPTTWPTRSSCCAMR